MAAAVEEKQDVQNADAEQAKTSVSSVEYTQAPASRDTGPKGSLDVLLDVYVPISVVIGSSQVLVRRLLQLGPGSVLTLDKSVDDPVELYLKGSKFATADIVVVEDKFAVRIKEILNINDTATQKVDKPAPSAAGEAGKSTPQENKK
jgi:flagellar motor switch protein FliN/FliY